MGALLLLTVGALITLATATKRLGGQRDAVWTNMLRDPFSLIAAAVMLCLAGWTFTVLGVNPGKFMAVMIAMTVLMLLTAWGGYSYGNDPRRRRNRRR